MWENNDADQSGHNKAEVYHHVDSCANTLISAQSNKNLITKRRGYVNNDFEPSNKFDLQVLKREFHKVKYLMRDDFRVFFCIESFYI